jgi:hypothetical protein
MPSGETLTYGKLFILDGNYFGQHCLKVWIIIQHRFGNNT